jgi:hypothetical protein
VRHHSKCSHRLFDTVFRSFHCANLPAPNSGASLMDISRAVSQTTSAITAASQPFDVRPPPDRGSRQRSGETWREFFAREHDLQIRRWANASAAELKTWISRDATAAKHRIPGQGGPHVYVWKENIDFPGFLYRRYVKPPLVEDIWDDYSNIEGACYSLPHLALESLGIPKDS